MGSDCWESGSEFHWIAPTAVEPPASVPWDGGTCFSTGRDALRQVARIGVEARGWRRLWVPDYFCQHVTSALQRTGIELRGYPDDPLRPVPEPPDAIRGDAILAVNYFGLRTAIDLRRRAGVDLVEDHSHDPLSAWAVGSRADFCVASLRKTLPVADGGILWSPAGHALPAAPEITAQRRRAAADKMAAMLLKSLYLAGHPVAKAEYRALAGRGERAFRHAAVSGMSEVSRSVIGSFPLEAWRRARRANAAMLRPWLASVAGLRLIAPVEAGLAPFGVVTVLETAALRERVRARLLEARVYPAVLWPLERTVVPVRSAARDLSRRILVLHCDGRYDRDDMRRVGEAVAAACAAADLAGPPATSPCRPPADGRVYGAAPAPACLRATNAAIRSSESRLAGIVSRSSTAIPYSASMNRMISSMPVESTRPLSISEMSSVRTTGSLT